MIGDNIKWLMKKIGYTQKQLAINSGCTESAISRYIKNERAPGFNMLKKLSEALGVRVDELLNFKSMMIENYQEEINKFCNEKLIDFDIKVIDCEDEDIIIEIKTGNCTYSGSITCYNFKDSLYEAIILAYKASMYAAESKAKMNEFSIDEKAQHVYGFANDLRNRFIRAKEECNVCHNPLESYYCENGIYIVRCRHCESFELVAAPSAETACLRRNRNVSR